MLRESVKLPFTSVVSYHTNEYGCGVAKFGKLLAEKLGVPFAGLNDPWGLHPLLSLKWSEVGDGWFALKDRLSKPSPYSVFWHDQGSEWVTTGAEIAFYADPSLGSPGLWCPSLLTPAAPLAVKLFTFGMAHKLQTPYYRKVREHLDAAGLDYRLRVSVGLHEGTSLSDATQHFDTLYEVMGREKVTILGILSDDAVQDELARSDYVLAFFEKGLRANNTTVHAALDAGCAVISNFDEKTPLLLKSAVECVCCIPGWPERKSPMSWDELIDLMERHYHAQSQDRQLADQR